MVARNTIRNDVDAKTIAWLLDEDNPPVRYLTLTRLLDKPTRHPDVVAACGAIAAYPPVRESTG